MTELEKLMQEDFSNPDEEDNLTLFKEYIDELQFLMQEPDDTDKKEVQRFLKQSGSRWVKCIPFIEYILKLAKDKKQSIVTDKLPSVMRRLGIKDTQLSTGERLVLQEAINYKPINDTKFFTWLKEKGYSDAIKTNIQFKKGEFTEEVKSRLKDCNFVTKDKVEYQTGLKIIRDRWKDDDIDFNNKLPPDDTCKVTIFPLVKIKGFI